jgi:hypothetical protein
MRVAAVLAGCASFLAAGLWSSTPAQEITTYAGPCDASAGVALGPDEFVVGNDEVNTLYFYQRGQAHPTATLSLESYLDTAGAGEADIEAAAVVGTRIYWITSHGRNGKGKPQPTRRRFFATDITPGAPPVLKPVGTPYRDLLEDLEANEALKPFKLGKAAKLAAEAEGGFNIEGLAATPDGGLLIGFRNPIRKGKALIVPLRNPDELFEGKTSKLGAPITLDLGGRGVRSIELIGSSYLIVAGPIADDGTFALFRWSGKPADVAVSIEGIKLGPLRPEGLFAIPGTKQVQLISDDGGVVVDGVECKKLPEAKQGFRSLIVEP